MSKRALKKVIVTGGAGFIGSAVIRDLIQNTNIEVINIDKLTYAGNLESLKLVEESPKYKFIKADICNKEEILKIFEDEKPDGVMHLAAESHVDRSIDSPADFIETNIIGTYNLLEASRKVFQNNPNFIFHHISTDEVFGDLELDDAPFTETHSYSPSSPYSASKASSDHLVRSWGRTYNLPIVVTNCSNNYGPFHFPEKLIPHVILNALAGKPLPIYGDGKQIRDWLFVEDHAKALIKVIQEGIVGETYVVGGNNEKANIEVVETICDILQEKVLDSGIKYRDLITFVKDRPGHDRRYAIDASKIKNELGWTPTESFETGLEKTIDWYLENEDWWQRVLSGDYKLTRLG